MDNSGTAAFRKKILSPVQFRLFLLAKLPSAFFAGVRVREATEERCVVSVPYKWFSRNPFGSTYFACLAMAGEMSTGALGMMHLYGRSPKVSMLVIKVEGAYFRKATGPTIFTCEDGALIRTTIADCIATGEARSVRARSIGLDGRGERVAEFFITWSFKARVKK